MAFPISAPTEPNKSAAPPVPMTMAPAAAPMAPPNQVFAPLADSFLARESGALVYPFRTRTALVESVPFCKLQAIHAAYKLLP
jgi:hypothetical protein